MMRTSKRKPKSQKEILIQHGVRSGLEDKIARQLTALGILYRYEERVIEYTRPPHKYTPDFELPNGIIVETKGRFIGSDRTKHLAVKKQHPCIDIRFVFSNPNTRINKGSSTTYAMWCDRHGFQYAAKEIPLEWINE